MTKYIPCTHCAVQKCSECDYNRLKTKFKKLMDFLSENTKEAKTED